jgi:cytoskeleton protein RodZ
MDGGVGPRLREVRVQRGLDLAEVEASTKIQARFLDAIEAEEWSLLPGEPYARSFVRTYASHLGLDGAEAVAQLPGAAGFGGAADRSPRVDPAPPQLAHSLPRSRLSPRRLATIVVLGLAAVLVAIGLSSLDGGSTPSSQTRNRGGGEGGRLAPGTSGQPTKRAAGATLALTATAEVWVCLLDRRGRALIDGQILEAGTEAGPYRSGGFTVSLGNGAVKMTVGGRAADIPPTADPIGFAIDRGGALRQLSEAERPTCA